MNTIPKDCKTQQRQSVLNALHDGTLSTIDAREKLGIAHPAGRVMELRKQGYPITTHKAWTYDVGGRRHMVAFYVLGGQL